MNAYPFSVFKRADRPSFLVTFKDTDGKYLPPLSTKKTTEQEAIQVAFEWLRDGLPKKQSEKRVKEAPVKDLVRKITTNDEAETLVSELKRLGWFKNIILKDTTEAKATLIKKRLFLTGSK